jgi:threonylcarbamoyladenosine tRNA methylthiotransferase MtaB
MPGAAVVTIGCRLNQSEGDALRTLLQRQGNQVVSKTDWGFENSEGSAEANFDERRLETCIINTCAVTERAASTSIKWIRRIAALKPKPRLVVTGCLAQAEAERLKQIEGVDEVITQNEKVKLVEKCPILPSRARAFLKIQDGCVNRCAYCLPAQIRGAPVSKPISTVEQEMKDLLANGYQEIVLVGLNLGTYGYESGTTLVNLLERIAQIKGDFRIRLGCLEPDSFDDRIIDRFEEFRLCRHLHIPLQSGDDKVLSLMHRKYTITKYRTLIDRFVERIPDINIGSDLMTGFPEEDERSFNQTLAFIRDLPIDYLHVFPYSSRPGTAAYAIKETVNPAKKKERVNILRALGQEKSINYRRRFLNKVLKVITEPGSWVMTDNYIRIFINSKSNGKGSGRLAKARVMGVTMDRTLGELVES